MGGGEEVMKRKRRQRTEDMLDVSIAYLRRVHLFTFYNGCHSLDNVRSIIAGGARRRENSSKVERCR